MSISLTAKFVYCAALVRKIHGWKPGCFPVPTLLFSNYVKSSCHALKTAGIAHRFWLWL